MLFIKDAYSSFLTAVAKYAPFILRRVFFGAGYRLFLGVTSETANIYKTSEKSLMVCFGEMKNCDIGLALGPIGKSCLRIEYLVNEAENKVKRSDILE